MIRAAGIWDPLVLLFGTQQARFFFLTFPSASEAVIENGEIFVRWFNRAVLPLLQSRVNNFFQFHYPLRLASGE